MLVQDEVGLRLERLTGCAWWGAEIPKNRSCGNKIRVRKYLIETGHTVAVQNMCVRFNKKENLERSVLKGN